MTEELSVAAFDDTDGAYQVEEPDPFAAVESIRPVPTRSVRAELVAPQPIAALSRPKLPCLAVVPALASVLPAGLPRGGTLAVTSSVSLLLALLSGASTSGAWIALVGMPAISADAIDEAGLDLSRLAFINPPDQGWRAASWTTAVGALLDAVDIVVARPGSVLGPETGQVFDADARRLNARTRAKDAVLMLFGQQAARWPSVQVQLSAQHARWSGISAGYGRITARQLVVSASGRGNAGRPRTAELRLPLQLSSHQISGQQPSSQQTLGLAAQPGLLSEAG